MSVEVLLGNDKFKSQELPKQLELIDSFYSEMENIHREEGTFSPELESKTRREKIFISRAWEEGKKAKSADEFNKPFHSYRLSLLSAMDQAEPGSEREVELEREYQRTLSLQTRSMQRRKNVKGLMEAGEVLRLLSDESEKSVPEAIGSMLSSGVRAAIEVTKEAAGLVGLGEGSDARKAEKIIKNLASEHGEEEARRLFSQARKEVFFEFEGEALKGRMGNAVIKPRLALQDDERVRKELKKAGVDDDEIESFMINDLPGIRKDTVDLVASLRSQDPTTDAKIEGDLAYARAKMEKAMGAGGLTEFFEGVDASMRSLVGADKESAALNLLIGADGKDFAGQLGSVAPDLLLALAGGSAASQSTKFRQFIGKVPGLRGSGAIATGVASSQQAGLVGSAATIGSSSALRTIKEAQKQELGWKKTLALGLASFFTEGGTTMAFGVRGIQKLYAPGTPGGNVLSGIVRRALPEGLSEGAEEATATILSHFTTELSLNPDATSADAAEGAVEAFAIGGLMGLGGGAFSGALSNKNPSNDLDRAAETAQQEGLNRTAEEFRRLAEEPPPVQEDDLVAEVGIAESETPVEPSQPSPPPQTAPETQTPSETPTEAEMVTLYRGEGTLQTKGGTRYTSDEDYAKAWSKSHLSGKEWEETEGTAQSIQIPKSRIFDLTGTTDEAILKLRTILGPNSKTEAEILENGVDNLSDAPTFDSLLPELRKIQDAGYDAINWSGFDTDEYHVFQKPVEPNATTPGATQPTEAAATQGEAPAGTSEPAVGPGEGAAPAGPEGGQGGGSEAQVREVPEAGQLAPDQATTKEQSSEMVEISKFDRNGRLSQKESKPMPIDKAYEEFDQAGFSRNPASAASAPEAPVGGKTALEENLEAARSLPPDQSAAVVMALEGESVESIAKKLKKNANEIRDILDRGGRTVKSMVGPQARGMLMLTEAGVTSTMNDVMRAERKARGAPPILRSAAQSHPEVMAMADDQMRSDPELAQRLIDDLASNKKDSISTVEEAILLTEKVHIMNERRRLETALVEGKARGERILEAQEALNELERRMTKLDQATSASGRIWGRTGRFRQNFIDADFSLMDMERSIRAVKGRELTEDERSRIREMADEIERLSNDLNIANEEATERDASKVYDEELARMAKDFEKIDPVIVRAAEKLAQRIERAAESAEERIRARLGRTNVGLDPTILWDLSIVGAKYLSRGVADFTKWSAEMVNHFKDIISKDDLEPYLKEIYEGSQEVEQSQYESVEKPKRKRVKKAVSGEDAKTQEDKINDRLKERAEEGSELRELRPLVQQLALNLVRSGVRGRDTILNRVHGVISSHFPSITKNQTRDLISGYGDYRPLDKDEAKTLLRKYKGEMQQLAKLEELEKALEEGRAAKLKKTGIERREVDQDERNLQKRVNEAKKRLSNKLQALGIAEETTEGQLKSILQARKTRAENEIADLRDAIKTGVRIVNNKMEVIPDAELKNLQAELEATRKEYKEAFPDKPLTEEEQAQKLEKSLDQRISRLEEELKEGRLYPGSKKNTITNPQIELKKARLQELRAERDRLRILDAETQEKKKEEELERRIEKATSPPKEKVVRATVDSQRVAELKEELKAIQEAKKNDPSRVNKEREKRLRKAIERELNPPELMVDRPIIPDSPEVAKLRRELENLRQSRAEEKRLAAWKTRAIGRMADMEKKMAAGDVLPKKRTPLALDKEARDIEVKLNSVKKRFLEMRHHAILQNRDLPTKIRQETAHVINTARAVMTSFDLSATGRQGILLAIPHPVSAARAFTDSLKAFGNDRFYRDSYKEIQSRSNAPLYEEAKLFLVDPDEYTLSKMEEAYMTRFIESASKKSLKSPLAPLIAVAKGVKASERAYITFLNRLRADVFDTLAGTIGLTGTGMDSNKSQALANYINVSTGRGNVGGGGSGEAAVNLNALFFSPRLVVSRFEYLVGRPLWRAMGADYKSKKEGLEEAQMLSRVIAMEYLKTATGLAVVLALGKLAGAEIEDEPTSSDYLKMKFGNTRVDFFGGLLQATVLISRIGWGETTTISGKTKALRGPDVEYGSDNAADVIWRFLRSKANPGLGAAINLAAGENVVGEPSTAPREGLRLITPMVLNDILDAAEEYGWSRAAAVGFLVTMGVGVQTFDPERAKFERRAEKERAKMKNEIKELRQLR